ncbi:eukaryotic translation initiation factor 2 subunit 2 [Lethenteron reissneri]|uniref:eukaryotic translation initiation factor 2 subunit 2 n=1 Tax=Lethenteron reissneri TaxID=7753 RepID=UPI002AB61898|nr:eukaryotic translation initiation factor 2 subunit 2 [Lethenteron reissneri]
MSDEEIKLFDPSLTKKKKKKKKPFVQEDGDGVDPEDTSAGATTDTIEPVPVPVEPVDRVDLDDADADSKAKKELMDVFNDFDLSQKKKKKKKKAFDLQEVDAALPSEEGLLAEVDEVIPEEEEPKSDGDLERDLDLGLGNKKKKPKKRIIEDLENGDDMFDGGDDDKLDDDGVSFTMGMSGPAWAGSERDYTYDELLSRVFNIMREKNPEMMAGEKRKFVMKPPQVVRVGTKKSSFANFAEICKLLHRQPKHLLLFLLSELGTSGSIDGNNQLIIKGRFQQKQIESVLRRYIKEYVTCHTCRSPDTTLQKDTRLYFLQCETCHSRCSVASIKAGFQAVTGKRAQMRAKAN